MSKHKKQGIAPLIIIIIGIAVGIGIQRQPGWNSRVLQIFCSAAVTGLIALVGILVLKITAKWKNKG